MYIMFILYFSGLKVVYNMNKPYGQRVWKVDVLCNECNIPEYKPLNKSAIYYMLTNTYLAEGGSGYAVLRDKRLSITRYGKYYYFSFVTLVSPWK